MELDKNTTTSSNNNGHERVRHDAPWAHTPPPMAIRSTAINQGYSNLAWKPGLPIYCYCTKANEYLAGPNYFLLPWWGVFDSTTTNMDSLSWKTSWSNLGPISDQHLTIFDQPPQKHQIDYSFLLRSEVLATAVQLAVTTALAVMINQTQTLCLHSVQAAGHHE